MAGAAARARPRALGAVAPRRLRRPDALEAAGVALSVLAASAVAVLGTPAVLGIVGFAGFVALVVLWLRAPHVAAVVVVLGFSLQGSLLFYVSPLFGPAKDAVVVAGLAALAWSALGRPSGWRRDADPWLVAGLALFLGLYVVNPGGGHDFAWASGTRLVVEAFGLFLVAYLGPRPERTWRWAIGALAVVVVVNAAFGALQQVIGEDRLVHQWGYQFGTTVRITGGGGLRSFGTFGDPFSYAAVLAVGLVVSAFALRGPWAAAVAGAATVGIVCSFVRTELVLLPVLALVWLVFVRQLVPAVAIVAAAIVGVSGFLLLKETEPGAPPGSALSVGDLNGRLQVWSRVIEGPDTVITGSGVGTTGTGLARAEGGGLIRPVSRYESGVAPPVIRNGDIRNVDSSYLATLADIGIAGLLALVAVFGRIVARVRRGLPLRDGRAWTVAALVLFMAVDGFTRSSLTAWPNGFVALFVLGAALAAYEHRPDPGPTA